MGELFGSERKKAEVGVGQNWLGAGLEAAPFPPLAHLISCCLTSCTIHLLFLPSGGAARGCAEPPDAGAGAAGGGGAAGVGAQVGGEVADGKCAATVVGNVKWLIEPACCG